MTPLELMLRVLNASDSISIEQNYKDKSIYNINNSAYIFYDTPYNEALAKQIIQNELKSTSDYCEEFYEKDGFIYYSFIELPKGDEYKIADAIVTDGFDGSDSGVAYRFIGCKASKQSTELYTLNYDREKVYLEYMAHDEVAKAILEKNADRKKAALESIVSLKYTPNAMRDIGSIFAIIEMGTLLGGKPQSMDDLKAKYKQKAKELHPDVNKSDIADLEFQALNSAYAFYTAFFADGGTAEPPKPIAQEPQPYDLKSEIKELGMTQKEFAEIAGIHTNTISQWIRGITEMPEWVKHFITYYKKSKLFDEIKQKINAVD